MPNLTQAWTTAEASMPHGWELLGLARGPRQADPVIRSKDWVAWARSADGRERVEGKGPFPINALLDLANKLRPLRGDRNG